MKARMQGKTEWEDLVTAQKSWNVGTLKEGMCMVHRMHAHTEKMMAIWVIFESLWLWETRGKHCCLLLRIWAFPLGFLLFIFKFYLCVYVFWILGQEKSTLYHIFCKIWTYWFPIKHSLSVTDQICNYNTAISYSHLFNEIFWVGFLQVFKNSLEHSQYAVCNTNFWFHLSFIFLHQ